MSKIIKFTVFSFSLLIISGGIYFESRGMERSAENSPEVDKFDLLKELVGLEKNKVSLDVSKVINPRSIDEEYKLYVFHSDSAKDGLEDHEFDPDASKFYYYLQTKDNRLLELKIPQGEKINLLSKSLIKLPKSAVFRQDSVSIPSADSIQTIYNQPTGHTVKKVAVIMLNFLNNTSTYPSSSVRSNIFTSTASVNRYYQESSFGNVVMTGHLRSDGDIFGWYTIPYNNTPCNYYNWGNAAASMAAADGFNALNYDNIIYIWPGAGSCRWAGLGMLGGAPAYSWINNFGSVSIVSHEFGHNLGMHHASSYRCTNANGSGATISETCTSNEYGDPFDVMGALSTKHHNNFHKGRVNWYLPSNTLDVASSGVYNIVPIETSNTGVQALRIPRKKSGPNVTEYLYVEQRKSSGFDNFSASSPVVNGLSLRLAPDYSTLVQSRLLDATPATFNNFTDSALVVGSTFNDLLGGISIEPLSVTSSTASLNVNLNCNHYNPKIYPPIFNRASPETKTYTYYIYISNNDTLYCPDSNFTVTPTLLPGWTQTPSSYTATIAPGQGVNFKVDITSPIDAQTNTTYPFTQTVVNNDYPEFSAATVGYYIIPVGGLAVYDVKTELLKDTQVRIRWKTGLASNTKVEYGTTTAYGLSKIVNNSVTDHFIDIYGLIPNTTYHFRANSKTSANVEGKSTDFTFTTLPPSPPIISNVKATGMTEKRANITWSTDEISDTQIEYGTTTSYGQETPLVSTLVASHSYTLTNLATGTLYHYRVKSKDSAGNLAVSNDYTFSTTADISPTFGSVNASLVTEIQAKISWNTNEISNTQVEYGDTTSYGWFSTLNTQLSTPHTQTLTGLTPATLYHYRVLSRDEAGNLAVSGDYTFTTTPQQAPLITNVRTANITNNRAGVYWTTNELADTKVEYGLTSSLGSQVFNGSYVTSHGIWITSLAPNTTYYYQVKSKDPSGNEAVSGILTLTTLP